MMSLGKFMPAWVKRVGLVTVILLFGATGVFVSLQDGLNTVWQVKQKPQNFVIGFIRNRLHTFTMVLGICFLLLISLIVSAAIEAAAMSSAVADERTAKLACMSSPASASSRT